jgi:N-acetylmuramoyl-L-alanine amidase
MLRGDDVADLQARLARLGFDCGKVDGIFGPLTADAFERFQRNCGLVTDGVCGADSVRHLTRLARQTGDGPGIAMLREGETFRDTSLSLACSRVVVGQFGGLSAVARLIGKQLRSAGALVVPLDEPDSLTQAQTANAFRADVYIGLAAEQDTSALVTYYAAPSFESVAGKVLANRLAAALTNHRALPQVDVDGRRLSILRETRMPAVLCRVGEVRHAVDQAPSFAAAVSDALSGWIAQRTP